MDDPQPIQELLGQVLRNLGIADPRGVTELVETWDSVAGEPWRGRSRPVGLSRGELIVEVSDGATASLLRYQTNSLLDRLGERVGRGLVTSVRIRVQRPGTG